jgi:glucuronate isomerase
MDPAGGTGTMISGDTMEQRSRAEQELMEFLGTVKVIDPHTHLVSDRLGARGLHDVLLYHMAVSELYSAGCPSGSRLTEYPGWPDREEAHARIEEALPFLPKVRNTSIQWACRMILRDLYAWDEPLTRENWRKLDDRIRERADDAAWHREVLRRCGIERAGAEWARRETGKADDILFYALEWGFFTRCQWGESDTALYELERCWGKTPSSPWPIGACGRPKTEKTVRSIDDARNAIQWYVDQLAKTRVLSTATHLSTDIDYRLVSDEEMAAALANRGAAGLQERDIYACWVHEQFLETLEEVCGDKILFQFSFAAEPLPFETVSRINPQSIAGLAEMIARHPGLRFQCFLASAAANQSLCTICRELPNLSLAAYWWHNFYPPIIEQVMRERLDMLPLNRQVGFFSDAYCVEWVYGKFQMIKRILARVLAEKVALGQHTTSEAGSIAAELLYDSPRALLRL